MIDLPPDQNNYVLPGDILLLRSKGMLAGLNRFSQRALRPTKLLRRAKFTHVALVISRTHIADAMPGTGVRIRRWQDAKNHYDLDKCVVARHPAMASDPDMQAALLPRVQYYYNQRYKISSLATRKAKHNRGLVCSQFVALVMHDVGLPSVVTAAMQGLPSDIDHNTRKGNGWRQFTFPEYGLYRDSLTAPDEASDVAPHLAAGMKLSDAVGEMLARSMSDLEAVSRLTAELDRHVLNTIDALQSLPAEEAAADSFTNADFADVSAASLLELWQALYLENVDATVRVLADEDAPQRLVRHRHALGQSIENTIALANTAIDQANRFKAQYTTVRELVMQGNTLPPELISQLHEFGLMILKPMEWLRDESEQSILARCQYYTNVAKMLSPLRDALGEDVEKLALDQLAALFDLENKCLTWVTVSKPVVAHLTELFSSLLPAVAEKPQDLQADHST